MFPPLFEGETTQGDPFALAQARAIEGCDAGLITHAITADHLRAALVLAPEVPLAQAVSMLITCGIGFSNALGALSPPEVAVHLEWDGRIRVNGAVCGRLRLAASTTDPEVEPDWLVIGLEVRLLPLDDVDPGLTPDRTSLFEEGCGEVAAKTLLESWSRHTLVWLNRWTEDGPAPLAAEWRGMVHGIGDTVTRPVDGTPVTGAFLGVDQDFGMLLKAGDQTHLIPLSALIEDPA